MASKRATLVCVATGLLAAYAAVFGVPVQDEPAVRPQPRYASSPPPQSQPQEQPQQHQQGTTAPQGEDTINAQRPSIAARAAQALFTCTHSGFHSTVFYDASVCAGHVDIRRASADECKAKDGVPFSTDAGLASWIRHTFGSDFVKVMLRGPEVVLANVTYGGGCAYRADFFLATKGTYELRGELVFEQYNAVNELVEKTWYEYAQRSLFPTGAQQKPPTLTCAAPHPFFSSPERQRPCLRDAGTAATQSQQWGRWVSTGESDANFKKRFPHYWLSFTGEPPLDDQTPDILGRMDFGTKYQWKPYGCRHTAYPQADALEALRNTTLFFFGDSHLRTTFYGALERLGVEFKRNKIWKGDRTDYIKSHNVTVGYVASYFLNMSRPTAAEMLAKDAVVLAGVGQHHASSCYAVRKHVAVVEEAMQEFDRHGTRVIWFGVPAHPHNRHMRLIQKRTDCRNNLRHRLFNKVQGELARFRGYPVVDTYAKSLPMIHTSPDGAHYYTWVREAWLDDIFDSVRLVRELSQRRNAPRGT